jgi:hypothetical protein
MTTRVKATCLPSGEIWPSAIQTNFMMSVSVISRLSCPIDGATETTARKTASKMRRVISVPERV